MKRVIIHQKKRLPIRRLRNKKRPYFKADINHNGKQLVDMNYGGDTDFNLVLVFHIQHFQNTRIIFRMGFQMTRWRV